MNSFYLILVLFFLVAILPIFLPGWKTVTLYTAVIFFLFAHDTVVDQRDWCHHTPGDAFGAILTVFLACTAGPCLVFAWWRLWRKGKIPSLALKSIIGIFILAGGMVR